MITVNSKQLKSWWNKRFNTISCFASDLKLLKKFPSVLYIKNTTTGVMMKFYIDTVRYEFNQPFRYDYISESGKLNLYVFAD